MCEKEIDSREGVIIDEPGNRLVSFHKVCRENFLRMAIEAVNKALEKNDLAWRKWVVGIWNEYTRGLNFLSGPSEAPKHEIQKRNKGWLILENVTKAIREGAGDQLR
jgi:hypothetical protein